MALQLVHKEFTPKQAEAFHGWLEKPEFELLKALIMGLLTQAEVLALRLTISMQEQPSDLQERDDKLADVLAFSKMLDLLDKIENGELDLLTYLVEPVRKVESEKEQTYDSE